MASINRGAPEAEQSYQQWPKEQWPTLLRAKRMYVEIQIPHDCRCLKQFIDEARYVWRDLGFTSRDDMIERGLGLESSKIRRAYNWLKKNQPDKPVSLKEALGDHGGDRGNQYTGGKRQPHIIRLPQYGTNPTYLLARLERDDPGLAAKVRAGQLSAHQAAIQAGFRKPTATVRLDSPRAAMRLLLKHFTRAELLKALHEVAEA
jgi:hypothetical protein